jgi:hypothetical protein
MVSADDERSTSFPLSSHREDARGHSAYAFAIVGSALGQRVIGNASKRKRLFFTFVDIPMKGMVFGQIGDKSLKLCAFFRPITRGSRDAWIKSNLTPFQHYNPYLTIGILCENMFMRHSLTSFLHSPLSVKVWENLMALN